MSDLQFHNLDASPTGGSSARVSNVETSRSGLETTYDFEHDDEDAGDSTGLLNRSAGSGTKRFPLSFSYYQALFDIDTKHVFQRLLQSMFPRKGCNFIVQQLRPQPDLYGPLWVPLTLVVVNAFFGHVFASVHDRNSDLDFGLLTASATAVVSYVLLMPALISGFLWWRKLEVNYTYIELVAMYGYSLSALVVACALWVIPVAWLQWLFLVTACLLSGFVLSSTLWSALRSANTLVAVSFMTFLLVAHFLLAVGFKMVFFSVPSVPVHAAVAAAVVEKATTVAVAALKKAAENATV